LQKPPARWQWGERDDRILQRNDNAAANDGGAIAHALKRRKASG